MQTTKQFLMSKQRTVESPVFVAVGGMGHANDGGQKSLFGRKFGLK